MLMFLVSASAYVVGVCVALTLMVPVPQNASRFARLACGACGVAAVAALAGVMAATVSGAWWIAVLLFALAIAAGAAWVRLSFSTSDAENDDDDDDDDGGGGQPRRPVPPAPSAPLGDPPDWSQFDRVREGWERDRLPTAR